MSLLVFFGQRHQTIIYNACHDALMFSWENSNIVWTLKVLIILDLANVKPYINKYKNIYNEKNKEKLKEYARIFFSEYGNVTQEEYYGNK